MFEQDYLMRMLLALFEAMNRAAERAQGQDADPRESAKMLEDAISNAVEMDGAVLLSLSPESIAQVMSVSGVDPNITQFVARSMLLESVYLAESHQNQLAALRTAQARAIADAYGFDLPEDPSDFDALTDGLEEAALAGGFYDGPAMYQESVGAGDEIDKLIDASCGYDADDDYGYYDVGYSVLDDERDAEPSGFGSFIERE